MNIKCINSKGFLISGNFYEIYELFYFRTDGGNSISTKDIDIIKELLKKGFEKNVYLNIKNNKGDIISHRLDHFDYTELRRNLIIDGILC